MEFKFQLENIIFYIELKEDPGFKPPKKIPLGENYTLNDLKSGKFNFYSLVITSKKKDQSLKHYVGGLLLTSNKDEISKELEEILEDFDYIDQILKDWELLEEAHGPQWKKESG